MNHFFDETTLIALLLLKINQWDHGKSIHQNGKQHQNPYLQKWKHFDNRGNNHHENSKMNEMFPQTKFVKLQATQKKGLTMFNFSS